MAHYTPKEENPAGRLWHLLDRAKRYSGETTYTQLPKAFGIQGNDPTALLRALLSCVEALEDIENRIKRITTTDPELFLYPIPHLREGFLRAANNSNFDQWKAAYLQPDYLNPLMFCAKEIAQRYPEQDVPKEQIEAFLKRVEDFESSLKSSTLEDSLKNRILECLEEIRQALTTYRIRGAYALTKALSLTFGEKLLHGGEFEEAKLGANKEIVQDFDKLVYGYFAMILLATESQKLLPQKYPFPLDDGAR